jgi:hypothetical protein
LSARGIIVSHESVLQWPFKFGQAVRRYIVTAQIKGFANPFGPAGDENSLSGEFVRIE